MSELMAMSRSFSLGVSPCRAREARRESKGEAFFFEPYMHWMGVSGRLYKFWVWYFGVRLRRGNG